MKCSDCHRDCKKVNSLVPECCRCAGITYALQCSTCHENSKVKVHGERTAASKTSSAIQSDLAGKGKTLAVKGGTQATTYGITKASSKYAEKSLQKAVKAQDRAIQGIISQSEYSHISGAIGKEVGAGKAVDTVLVRASEESTEKLLLQAERAGTELVPQIAGKSVGAGAKLIEGASTPWQLGSVAAEFGAEAIASAAGANKTVQTVTGKLVGVSSSAAIGAAVAGPVGAAGAVLIWGVGEGIGQAVDAIVKANTRQPVLPCDPVEASPMCDKCFTSMAIPIYAKNGLNLCAKCSSQV